MDQIWFSVDGVKELYDNWVTTQGFNPKKVFSMKGVDTYFPKIIIEVKKWVWEIFTNMTPSTHSLCYFPKIIQEFYAFYVVRHNEQKYKMSITKQSCLESVLVRGVEVPYTALEINKLYFACDLDSVVKCKKMISGGLQSFLWLASVIAKGLLLWDDSEG